MSEGASVFPETASEPSLAELFDPAALEARLAEARARRTEALARRAAAGETPPGQPRRPRIRTLDMAAVPAAEGGPARTAAPLALVEASAALPLTLVAPTARRREPEVHAGSPARSGDTPVTAPMPRLLGEMRHGGTVSMPERLAAAVARPPAGQPSAAAVASPARERRQPLAILGLGLVVGAAIAAGAFVATRAPAPDARHAEAPATARPSANDRPALRFGASPRVDRSTPGRNTAALGYGLPDAGAAPIAAVADGAPSAPPDAVLPRSAMAAVPVAADAGTPVGTATVLRDSSVAVFVPVAVLPPLALGLDAAPPLPGEAEFRAPTTVSAAAPSRGLAAPVRSLPQATALPPFAAIAAQENPRFDSAPAVTGPAARVRFAEGATAAATGGPRASVAWPEPLEGAPSVSFALLEPSAADQAPERSPERPAATRQPASERAAARATRRAERPAPTPAVAQRSAVAEAVARARLERSVENMLRDRLLDN